MEPNAVTAAAALLRAGDLDGAEVACRRILRADSRHADALHLLGVVEHRRGRHAEAVDAISRAAALAPRRGDYRNNLGAVLMAMGRLDEAIAAYIEALRLDPSYADARSNLGVALHRKNQLDRAAASFEAALRLAPEHPDALFNYANLLRERGDATRAVALYRRSLRVAPGRVEALGRLGRALLDCGRAEEAADYFRAAGPPGTAPALGAHLPIRSAAACPTVFPDVAAIGRFHDGLEAALAAHPEGVRLPLGGAVASGCYAPSFQMAHHGRDILPIKARFAAAFRGNFPDLHARPGQGLPRIGFVANSPHHGGFLRCIGGIAERLDPRRFRVVVFGDPPALPSMRAAIRRPDAEFIEVPELLPEAAERIAAAHCDVLYHWQVGTDSFNYFLPFSRPAPVQCTSWGTHGTSGIPAMGYYLSSGSVEGPGSEAQYTEDLVRLATPPLYLARVRQHGPPATRAEFGLPEGVPLYACLQRLLKFHPDFDALIAGVLRRDRRGLVLLRDDGGGPEAGELMDRLRATIPDVSSRVVLLPRSGLDQYHRLLSLADAALDTIPFGGGLTAYDAFSLGIPVVTLPGATVVARQTLALYLRMGITELVAGSADDYADLATRLGAERPYREDIAGRIASASSVLFEDSEAVREHERFFARAASEARSDTA